MKITPQDVLEIMFVFPPSQDTDERRMKIASLMCDIYDRGYEAGHDDASDHVYEPQNRRPSI